MLFYSDFIASENQELQDYGQLIVNFLQLIYKATNILENEYDVKMSTQLDSELIDIILSQEDFTSTTFSIISETDGENWIKIKDSDLNKIVFTTSNHQKNNFGAG